MVIPTDREKASNAIAAYMRGEIDNFALDDATLGRKTRDESVVQISMALWGCYDDVKRHRVSLDAPGWKMFRRCLAFLETDLELPKHGGLCDPRLWPFQHQRQLFAARPTMEKFNLPRFDPALHNLRVWSRPISLLVGTLWIVFALVMLSLMMGGLLRMLR